MGRTEQKLSFVKVHQEYNTYAGCPVMLTAKLWEMGQNKIKNNNSPKTPFLHIVFTSKTTKPMFETWYNLV